MYCPSAKPTGGGVSAWKYARLGVLAGEPGRALEKGGGVPGKKGRLGESSVLLLVGDRVFGDAASDFEKRVDLAVAVESRFVVRGVGDVFPYDSRPGSVCLDLPNRSPLYCEPGRLFSPFFFPVPDVSTYRLKSPSTSLFLKGLSRSFSGLHSKIGLNVFFATPLSTTALRCGVFELAGKLSDNEA
jgi:hypothetical protein